MQTKALKLRENFYWAGILDDTLRVFDIIMYTEFGTTYNSYIYKAGDKVILFETVKAKFFDDYLKELKEITDVTKIDYLVVNHTEPDHAGSVEKLLELNPQLKIIATPTAVSFLQNIVNRDFCSIAVRDEQEMQIGNITLRFLHVPNLHWPDTMYTYIEEEQALVTCDSFGSHYASEDILVSKVKNEDDYWKATKYYFDCIIGPFKPFMLKALERVRQLDVSIICTGHGPVLDAGIDKMYNTYEEWCTVVNPNQKKTVVMPYVSAYGYTGQLAEQIAKGIEDSGDIEVRRYDMVTADQAKVLDELGFADGILFGTPTIVGEALKPIWDLTTSIFAGTHGGKLASAFGSYGWSGEGVPHIIERLKQLRMRVPDEGFKVRFKPGEVDMLNAYDYGYNFGCILQDKENPKKKSAKTTLVKCLVCGEIFDSSLEVCPVCGVGKENFVPVEAEDTGYRRDTQNLYAIIGGGAAGLNAAKAIRERDKTGSIYMLSNEAYPAYNRPMLTKSLVAGLDGLLVPGGIDVSPLLYGQDPIQAVTFTQEAQDRFELALIREAVAQGKPILAVCRGAQLVNVALGGTLYQDIHEQAGATICHRQDSRIPSECTHTISTVPGTLFERLMNGQTAVNSFHHQAVRDLAPGLVAAAWSADGILEAFESPTRPILGVQFHPELLLDAAPGFLALFQQLVHWK